MGNLFFGKDLNNCMSRVPCVLNTNVTNNNLWGSKTQHRCQSIAITPVSITSNKNSYSNNAKHNNTRQITTPLLTQSINRQTHAGGRIIDGPFPFMNVH